MSKTNVLFLKMLKMIKYFIIFCDLIVNKATILQITTLLVVCFVLFTAMLIYYISTESGLQPVTR